jgi:cell division protein FtsW
MKSFLQSFKGDRVIWVMLVFLTIYSVLAVASSVASVEAQGGSIPFQISKHVVLLVIGWGVVYLTHLLPYRWFSKLANFILWISIALLVVTILYGEVVNKSARWLPIPGTGLTFQTSDLAKIALIMYVARFLSRNQSEITQFGKGFLPVLLMICLVCVLILKENFSTAFILFTTCLILLYIGRVRVKYLAGLAGVGLVMVTAVYFIGKLDKDESRSNTWANRWEQFISPDSTDQDALFQRQKANMAIASGGFFGKFAGHSIQKRSLPLAFSDFIFAIIIEEYGLLFGALPLIFFYLILLRRAGVIVAKCDRTFPAFLTIGLMTGLVIQAMINMGVAAGLMPVTGQTLPWISKGGTSILFTALSLGIILGISRSLEEEAKVEAE